MSLVLFISFNVINNACRSGIKSAFARGHHMYQHSFVQVCPILSGRTFIKQEWRPRYLQRSKRLLQRNDHHHTPDQSHFRLPETCSASDALRLGIQFLEENHVPESRVSAELLLSTLVKLKRSDLRGNAAAAMLLSTEQAAIFETYILKRMKRVPVQYILGEWDFYNLEGIHVRPPTLIPRPETEELVERILSTCRAEKFVPRRFLEVGPGSGAITLALLRAWPSAHAVAVDIARHAVELTRENAGLLGLDARVQVVQSSIAAYAAEWTRRRHEAQEAGGGKGGEEEREPFDMVVSNPPYIPSADMLSLDPEVADNEDHTALDGGPDGLEVVEDIVAAAPALLRRGGSVWLEVDASHPPLIAARYPPLPTRPPAAAIGQEEPSAPGGAATRRTATDSETRLAAGGAQLEVQRDRDSERDGSDVAGDAAGGVGRVWTAGWWNDLCGRPRFVRLRVGAPGAGAQD